MRLHYEFCRDYQGMNACICITSFAGFIGWTIACICITGFPRSRGPKMVSFGAIGRQKLVPKGPEPHRDSGKSRSRIVGPLAKERPFEGPDVAAQRPEPHRDPESTVFFLQILKFGDCVIGSEGISYPQGV